MDISYGEIKERYIPNKGAFMQKPVVAVYDKKIGAFDTPMAVRHVGEAVREWSAVKQDKNNKYGRNPEDFDLFQIANYDEIQGTMENIKPHIHLDTGV